MASQQESLDRKYGRAPARRISGGGSESTTPQLWRTQAASQDDAWKLIQRLQEENEQLRTRCLNSPFNSGRFTDLSAEIAARLDERSRSSVSFRLPRRPMAPSPPSSPATSADGEENDDLREFESRMCPPAWYQTRHELCGEGTIIPGEGSWKQKWDSAAPRTRLALEGQHKGPRGFDHRSVFSHAFCMRRVRVLQVGHADPRADPLQRNHGTLPRVL